MVNVMCFITNLVLVTMYINENHMDNKEFLYLMKNTILSVKNILYCSLYEKTKQKVLLLQYLHDLISNMLFTYSIMLSF